MTKKQILAVVQEIFRDIFDNENLHIKEETNADDIEDWDSFAQVRITIAIEKKFGIKFDFNELSVLHNVGEMLELIGKKRGTCLD